MKTKQMVFLFLSVVTFLSAQNDYVFNVSNQSYNDLVSSTSLNNGQIWDDPGYEIPLGFDFQIGPHIFNTIHLVEWSVGGVLSSSEGYFGIVSLVVPIGQDIIDLGYGTGISQSNISYLTEGVIGNQILKIEWNNVGFWDDETEGDFMNFQIWLYEGTNIVEYRYGSSQINNPQGSFEGETGPIVVFVPSMDLDTDLLEEAAYFLSGNPANPTVIVVEPGEEPQEGVALQGMIPNGTVFTFTPQNLSIDGFENLDFVTYPNPVKDYFHIQTNTGEYQVHIYNNLGQRVKHVVNSNGPIDVSNLSSGSYIIEIETRYGKQTKQLLKY